MKERHELLGIYTFGQQWGVMAISLYVRGGVGLIRRRAAGYLCIGDDQIAYEAARFDGGSPAETIPILSTWRAVKFGRPSLQYVQYSTSKVLGWDNSSTYLHTLSSLSRPPGQQAAFSEGRTHQSEQGVSSLTD